jgi:hypothetical protein
VILQHREQFGENPGNRRRIAFGRRQGRANFLPNFGSGVRGSQEATVWGGFPLPKPLSLARVIGCRNAVPEAEVG